jgi:hypothetical protein
MRAAQEWVRGLGGPKTERAHYFDLFTAEKKISEIQDLSAESVMSDIQPSLRALRDPIQRRDAAKGIEMLAQEWEEDIVHIECRDFEFTDCHFDERIRTIQAENPRMTPGQAWFQAQLALRKQYYLYLADRKKELDAAIGKFLEEGRTMDAKMMAARLAAKHREVYRANDNIPHERGRSR